MDEQAFQGVFRGWQTQELIQHIREEYGDELEFLWPKFPRDAIWRHPQTRKWYGLVMAVSRRKLGFDSDEVAEILDVRFAKGEALDFVASNPNVYPGYHMNKNSWITMILDESMTTAQILALVDNSYRLAGER